MSAARYIADTIEQYINEPIDTVEIVSRGEVTVVRAGFIKRPPRFFAIGWVKRDPRAALSEMVVREVASVQTVPIINFQMAKAA